jgi:predicted nicotinamide N-methyase
MANLSIFHHIADLCLHQNMRKGDFSRAKVKGKRVLELGAGMGLGGIAFSMLGAEVILTDTSDVLPLLRRNCEANLGCGAVAVAELGEGNVLHFPVWLVSLAWLHIVFSQIGSSQSKYSCSNRLLIIS